MVVLVWLCVAVLALVRAARDTQRSGRAADHDAGAGRRRRVLRGSVGRTTRAPAAFVPTGARALVPGACGLLHGPPGDRGLQHGGTAAGADGGAVRLDFPGGM